MNTLMQNEESDIIKVIEGLQERFCSHDVGEDANIWDELIIVIDEVYRFVVHYQLYYKCMGVAEKLRSLLQTIADTEELFHDLVNNGPFKSLFSKITMGHSRTPPWFISMFYTLIAQYVDISDPSLRSIIRMIWKSKSFNNQKAYAQILINHYDWSRVDSLQMFGKCNKELRNTFKCMFFKNDSKSIRSCLNQLNLEEERPPIFSVLTYQIIIGELFKIQNTWVDFNIFLKTITFECCRSYLASHKSYIKFKEDCNTDTITIYLKFISSIKFKSSKNEDKLVLYLSEPCEAQYESSVQVLEKFRMVTFYVRDNKESFRDLIYKLWYQKFEEIPTYHLDSTLPDSFELNLLNDETGDTYVSPTSLDSSPDSNCVLSCKVRNFSQNLIINETQLDERLISQDASQEEYISDIQKTPERLDLNIVVDVSPVSNHDLRNDSIAIFQISNQSQINDIIVDSQISNQSQGNDSVDGTQISNLVEASQNGAEITALCSKPSRLRTTDKVLIADICPSPISISSTQNSNKLNFKKEAFKSSLQSIPEVIDLVSPEPSVPTNIEVINGNLEGLDEENLRLAISQAEIIFDVEQILSGNKDAIETAAGEIKTVEESQSPQPEIEKNVRSKTLTTINTDSPECVKETGIGDQRIRKSSQSSTGSQKGQKRKRTYNDRYDPTYTRHGSISPISSPLRKKLTPKKKPKDTEAYEFNQQSFFSDADTSAHYTYTRTRRVKKTVKYQSDPEGWISSRKHVSKIDHEQPPVKRIKTIPPVRRLTQDGTPTATPEQKTTPTISRSQRKLTDIHNYDHLDLIEHPVSPIFRLPVTGSINVPETQQQKTPTGSPENSSPKNSSNKSSPKKISNKSSPKKSSPRKYSNKSSPKKILPKGAQIESSPKAQNNSRSPKRRRYSLESGFGIDDDEGLDEITYNKIRANLDRFDRIVYNCPSTQSPPKKRRKINYFSSSSTSPDIGAYLNDQTNYFDPAEPSSVDISPKTNKNKENWSPKKSNKKTKMSVIDNKKVKRSPVKKKYNIDLQSPKKGKKSKAADKNIIELDSDSSPELSPVHCDLTNIRNQVERCEQCGAQRKNASPDMQKSVKKICELHLNTLNKTNRLKFCKDMEIYFKKRRQEN